MLRLSYFCKFKDLWSLGCSSTVCDARNEWFFGCLDEDWSVKVPDIYCRSTGSTLNIYKKHKIIDKGTRWQHEKNLKIKEKDWCLILCLVCQFFHLLDTLIFLILDFLGIVKNC